MKNPRFLTGLLLGAIFMLPVMAVMALGAVVAGFAFLPFSLFDWLARYLPGPVITFGIDTIVSVITTFNLGPTSETAKTAEQLMSLGLLPAAGALAGGLFFLLRARLGGKSAVSLPGLIVGGSVGAAFVLMFLAVPLAGSADEFSNAVWFVGLFVLWGIALSYAWRILYATSGGRTAEAAAAQALNRRQFLVQVGATTAVVTVAGSGLAALLNTGRDTVFSANGEAPDPQALAEAVANLPNAGDPVEPVPGTRPEVTPVSQHYRIDINTIPPVVDGETWRLKFTSTVNTGGEKEVLREYTLDELMAFDPIEAYITMSCISNRVGGDLISTTRWTGVPLKTLLDEVGVPEGATNLWFRCADGFYEDLDLRLVEADDRIMLAYWWDGELLPTRNGFPLRIHIPDRYGMKQPKWITELEFRDRYDEGYWVERGWDEEAIVRTTSVIDTVAAGSAYEQDGRVIVPVGGIAWAGARGISTVQVRVDGGEWQDARVRSAISDRTWQLWRFDWAFEPGTHVFEVRCAETNGTPQLEGVRPVRPSGATGLHSRRETLPSSADALLGQPAAEATPDQ